MSGSAVPLKWEDIFYCLRDFHYGGCKMRWHDNFAKKRRKGGTPKPFQISSHRFAYITHRDIDSDERLVWQWLWWCIHCDWMETNLYRHAHKTRALNVKITYEEGTDWFESRRQVEMTIVTRGEPLGVSHCNCTHAPLFIHGFAPIWFIVCGNAASRAWWMDHGGWASFIMSLCFNFLVCFADELGDLTYSHIPLLPFRAISTVSCHHLRIIGGGEGAWSRFLRNVELRVAFFLGCQKADENLDYFLWSSRKEAIRKIFEVNNLLQHLSDLK